MIIKMAFKNLLRHKKRTALTLITTIVGILLAVIGEGLNSGLEKQVSDLSIKSEISYGRIFGKNFYEDKDNNDILEYPINMESVKGLENVPISKRISFTGSITDSKEELATYFMGVNKIDENKVFSRDKYIISGNFLNNDTDVQKVLSIDSNLIQHLSDPIVDVHAASNTVVSSHPTLFGPAIFHLHPLTSQYISKNAESYRLHLGWEKSPVHECQSKPHH